MIEKLPEGLADKLETLIAYWADTYLDGKPAILATCIYCNIEKQLIKETNEVLKTFPDKE